MSEINTDSADYKAGYELGVLDGAEFIANVVALALGDDGRPEAA